MKKVLINTLHIFCFSFLLSTLVSAQVGTWTGNGGNDLWSNAANWGGNTIPGSSTNVVIPFNSGNVVFDMSSGTVRSLYMYNRTQLVIQSGKRLMVANCPTSQAVTVSQDATIENNGSFIVADGQDNAMDIRGVFQNSGYLEIAGFPGKGLLSHNKFINVGQIFLYNLGSGNDYAVDIRAGLFYNDGSLILSEKNPVNGLWVESSAELQNDKNGEIYFENGNNGLFLIDGLVNNHNLIHMNQTSIFLDFIRLNGDVVNHHSGGLIIEFNGSGNTTAVRMSQGGTFTNDGTIEVEGTASNQTGFYISSNCVLENTSGGNFESTRVGTGVHINEFVARFENAGFCKFRYNTGVWNQLGTVENTGTMRFDSGADLRNSSTLNNEDCATMTFHGDIVNIQGNFTNNGWIYASSSVMTYRNFTGSAVQNHGVIHDPYDFFEGNVTSQGFRVGSLEMVSGQVVYEPALEGGSSGSIAVSAEWYRYSNLTSSLGYYDFINNRLVVYFPQAEGRRYMWIQFTNSSGCTAKMYVLFDAPLEGPDQETNNHDFALPRHAADQENTKAAQLKIFPNPSNGQFNLQFDQVLTGTSELRLMDVTGRTVWTQKEQDLSALSLDLTGQLPTGVYHLQVLHANALLTTQRLVLQAN